MAMNNFGTYLTAFMILFVVAVFVGYGADMFFDWALNNDGKTSKITYVFLGVAIIFCVLLIKILNNKRD